MILAKTELKRLRTEFNFEPNQKEDSEEPLSGLIKEEVFVSSIIFS